MDSGGVWHASSPDSTRCFIVTHCTFHANLVWSLLSCTSSVQLKNSSCFFGSHISGNFLSGWYLLEHWHCEWIIHYVSWHHISRLHSGATPVCAPFTRETQINEPEWKVLNCVILIHLTTQMTTESFVSANSRLRSFFLPFISRDTWAPIAECACWVNGSSFNADILMMVLDPAPRWGEV